MKHKKNKHPYFCYVVFTRNHRHKKNGHVCFSCTYAYAYVAVIPSEDNIRKIRVSVLLMLRAFVNAYVAAVLTSVTLILMLYAYAHALVKTSLKRSPEPIRRAR